MRAVTEATKLYGDEVRQATVGFVSPESSRTLGAHSISEASYSFFFYVRGREIYILILFVFFLPSSEIIYEVRSSHISYSLFYLF